MPAEVTVGARVALNGTDPWEFGTAVGVGPHHGRVIGLVPGHDGEEALVVRMEEPFTWRGHAYEYVRVTARHYGKRNAVRALRASSATPAAFAPATPAGEHVQAGSGEERDFVVGDARLIEDRSPSLVERLLTRLRAS